MTNFSKIKIGTWFTTPDGSRFKKTGDLNYEDPSGMEYYIDPLFDKKLGKAATDNAQVIDTSAKVVKGTSEEDIDTSAKVVKSSKKKGAKAAKKSK